MSSTRCLNWSRPSPGRHPLRKQMSCIESPSSSSSSSSASAVTSATVAAGTGDRALVAVNSSGGGGGTCGDDFCQFFVTSAIIHTNRFQNYHSYNQAHRGSVVTQQQQQPQQHQQRSLVAATQSGTSVTVRAATVRRPSSASVSSSSSSSTTCPTGSASGAGPGRRGSSAAATGDRRVLTKQLSLDHSAVTMSGQHQQQQSWAASTATVVQTSMAAMAANVGSPVINGSTDGAPKPLTAGEGMRKRPPVGGGATVKNDTESDRTRRTSKPVKQDSRINIKIFLGQTAQQDSSDNGVSDTEAHPCMPAQRSADAAAAGAPTGEGGTSGPAKPKGNNVGSSATAAAPAAGHCNGPAASGRNSSLAQRRAQFQANRQNSEAHERRPPLVRAMSAPIRPVDADQASKFLQSKKKPRRRKILREKDEFNICEEDEFSDDGGKPGGVAGSGSMAKVASTVPLRSRSVLGGACDIETLVSLLSSGGSDSEKEQDSGSAAPGARNGTSPTADGSPTYPVGKTRAPMLKKAGKSVSFQETDLKPTVSLNRDYLPTKRPSMQPVANRIRRSQQLVNSLNAFQSKDSPRQSQPGVEKEMNEERSMPLTVDDSRRGSKVDDAVAQCDPGDTIKADPSGTDVQTPKEQECYRLFLKMSKKGLAVSYDTILRGMLTPTELRVLQKQRNKQKKSNDTEGGAGSPEHSSESEAGGLELKVAGIVDEKPQQLVVAELDAK